MRRIDELMQLEGRVAVVTGGAGHIGRAIAAALAELGAHVAVVDRSEESCADACEQIRQDSDSDRELLALAVDLLDSPQVPTIVERVVERWDGLDILVNCAAFVGQSNLSGWVTDFSEQSPDVWRQALELNLTVPFVLTQAAAPYLRRRNVGSVINVASIYGMLGPDMSLYEGTAMGNPAAYGASKGGLLQHTRYLATVLAPDIRVNAISPGGIQRGQPDSFQTKYVQRTPLQRMGCEEDLKGAAAFLASDLSAYVTGQNLVVDGGWSTW